MRGASRNQTCSPRWEIASRGHGRESSNDFPWLTPPLMILTICASRQEAAWSSSEHLFNPGKCSFLQRVWSFLRASAYHKLLWIEQSIASIPLLSYWAQDLAYWWSTELWQLKRNCMPKWRRGNCAWPGQAPSNMGPLWTCCCPWVSPGPGREYTHACAHTRLCLSITPRLKGTFFLTGSNISVFKVFILCKVLELVQ